MQAPGAIASPTPQSREQLHEEVEKTKGGVRAGLLNGEPRPGEICPYSYSKSSPLCDNFIPALSMLRLSILRLAGLLLLAFHASSFPLGQEQDPLLLNSEAALSASLYTHQLLQSTIRDVLVDHDIIGDVLDDFAPSYYLDLSYPKSHETVLLGNDIPVDAVSTRPVFTFHPLDEPYSVSRPKPKKTRPSSSPSMHTDPVFTLVLTDPDAKSRDNPKWSEMCHWILTNLTTPVALKQPPFRLWKAKSGELEEYLPPGPPPKTGAHRYVFVLLEGDGSNLRPPTDRRHWGYGEPRHGVRDWAEENGLTVVGANFFFAQNEKQ